MHLKSVPSHTQGVVHLGSAGARNLCDLIATHFHRGAKWTTRTPERNASTICAIVEVATYRRNLVSGLGNCVLPNEQFFSTAPVELELKKHAPPLPPAFLASQCVKLQLARPSAQCTTSDVDCAAIICSTRVPPPPGVSLPSKVQLLVVTSPA
jgi:hypothetical protein